MGIIRTTLNDLPTQAQEDKPVLFPHCIDEEWKVQYADGRLKHITGRTGIVNVDGIVQDGAAEAPGNGLPVEARDQIYIIVSNTSLGS